jgi:DNA polymerase-3 subunit delta
MDALAWLREKEQQPLRPVYAVSGDDPYLIRESIGRLVKVVFPGEQTEVAVSRFPGAVTPLATVLDEIRTLSFFTRRRLVVVEDADPFVTKYRKELEAYVERPYESGILILQVKTWVATTILAKLVEQHGLAINCSGPRESDLLAWLTQLAATDCNAQLEPDAARLLLEMVGPEAGILAMEVEKLAVYVGETRRIERHHVATLVGAGRVETIWKTLDAALAGQGRMALKHLNNLLYAGEEPVMMLAALSTNLMKLHHVGQLRAARVNLTEACERAGIPSFAVDKTRRQHAHLGPRRVEQLPATLLRADLDLKGGSTLEPRVILERFLLGLALPRTD